jgi:plasmid stabilization system protein ParE
MRRFRIRPHARLDLLEIWHYIAAEGGVDAADRMVERLNAAIVIIRSMPGIGHERVDVLNPKYRFWAVKPYVIAYFYDAKTLTVARVLHGARDFRRLLK